MLVWLPRFQGNDSMRGPIGRLVVAAGCQLVRLRTIGEHGPDLALAGTRGFKNQMAAIGRPARALVTALIAGHFQDLPRGRVHDVKVVVVIGAAPTEGQQLAVRRPGGVDDVALVWHVNFRGARAVGIHQVELRSTSSIADESDGLPGLGVPSGRYVDNVAAGLRQPLGAAAVYIADVKFSAGPLHGRRKNDLRAIGRPGWRTVRARETGERDDSSSVHGIHADLRAGYTPVGRITGKGNARPVGRPPRR